MYSPQLIQLLDVIPTTLVRNVPGLVPRTLEVFGSDFRDVTAVTLNGFTSPSFVVLSANRLLAEVPDEVKSASITEVLVMSASLTLTAQSLVDFTVGPAPRKVRGPQRLMQEFLRILLRTPGSNRFHPQSGGGLAKRVGKNMTQHAAADATVAVAATERYIVSQQTPIRSIPANERLLAAEIIGIQASQELGELNVTIKLLNHTGQSAAATLIA
jgi:hypothetical protein